MSRRMEAVEVELTFRTIRVVVHKDKIVSIPPSFRCWLGKKYSEFYLYYERVGKLKCTRPLKTSASGNCALTT